MYTRITAKTRIHVCNFEMLKHLCSLPVNFILTGDGANSQAVEDVKQFIEKSKIDSYQQSGGLSAEEENEVLQNLVITEHGQAACLKSFEPEFEHSVRLKLFTKKGITNIHINAINNTPSPEVKVFELTSSNNLIIIEGECNHVKIIVPDSNSLSEWSLRPLEAFKESKSFASYLQQILSTVTFQSNTHFLTNIFPMAKFNYFLPLTISWLEEQGVDSISLLNQLIQYLDVMLNNGVLLVIRNDTGLKLPQEYKNRATFTYYNSERNDSLKLK